jgi:DNA-binding beta-propeller fold protein YncE
MKMTGAEMDAMLVAKPTWAEPDPSGKFVYVACNGNREVVEVDVDKWEITRRFRTAAGPYNLDITPDGKMLIVSHKQDGSVGFWNLAEGREVARVPTSKKVSHGIAVSPDSRYAFVTAEGMGGEPGAVDVFDLLSLKLVSSASIGKQAAGISFWKMR